MANTTSGKLPGYETTFITRGEMNDDSLKELGERVRGIITSFGGEVVTTEDWGKRKLAYPIEKETRGQYTYFVYTGKEGVVHEIERNLRIHDHVLRFLSVNLDDEFEAQAFVERRAKLQAAAKKREEEREARREERMAERRERDDRYQNRNDYQDRYSEQAPAEQQASGGGEEE
jgi:small subunit ribosomal protein S6